MFPYYACGDLAAFCKLKSPLDRCLDQTLAKQLFVSLATAVGALHSSGIVHRDIKPENVLIDFTHRGEKVEAIISDFGFATELKNLKKEGKYERVGTTPYMPLEMFSREVYDQRVDIWSLGVLLYSILYGKLAFASTNGFLAEK